MKRRFDLRLVDEGFNFAIAIAFMAFFISDSDLMVFKFEFVADALGLAPILVFSRFEVILSKC